MLKDTLTLGGQLLILSLLLTLEFFFTVKTNGGNLISDDSEKFLFIE